MRVKRLRPGARLPERATHGATGYVLYACLDAPMLETIRRHVLSGRPLGTAAYLDALGRLLGRDVRPRPRGRPRRGDATVSS